MHQANGVSTLYVGLLGTFSTAAGVQTYDVATQQFGAGQLLSGLPSDNIQGFAVSNDHVYVATQNGIGRWNMSANDWDNPLTTADGLLLRTLKISNSFQTHSTSHPEVV